MSTYDFYAFSLTAFQPYTHTQTRCTPHTPSIYRIYNQFNYKFLLFDFLYILVVSLLIMIMIFKIISLQKQNKTKNPKQQQKQYNHTIYNTNNITIINDKLYTTK
jgi:flagellar biosynthesis/type III secretory pathway M-ring protein FliF/YscJ